VKLAMISGSLRHGSANSAALRATGRYLRSQHRAVALEWCAINDLPLFDEDVEASGWPPTVARLRRQVETANAVLISTPEYNGSVSGVLKNALDWLSRPDRASPLVGKPVATMSASPTNYGAVWAQENLRFVLEQSLATVINEDLIALPRVFDSLDQHGELAYPAELAKVHALCDTVVAGWRGALNENAITA
jgi:chromate reductase, NAD(P)H dehydrogenase (quinone)